jgi:hypothetical protein
MLRHFVLVICLVGIAWRADASATEELKMLNRVVESVCQPSDAGYQLNFENLSHTLPGAKFVSTKRRSLRRGAARIIHAYMTPNRGEISFESIERNGLGLRLSTSLFKFSDNKTRPTVSIMSSLRCKARQGRAIRYDGKSIARTLGVYGPDLETILTEEPLNPPMPSGKDVKGVTVVHVDSGIAYDQPHLSARLARDSDGKILGTDLWDEDGLPYDADASLSPFLIRRHGSLVADVLLKEGPLIRLIPIRFPRNNMKKFFQIIDIAVKYKSKIVVLPMGSNDANEWMAFKTAAAQQPEILFIVSAGNNGRDIDTHPVFPAAFALENMIVVTSLTETGKIAPGSNWGKISVDIGVPAEQLSARDYRGLVRPVRGSSFAVPRVAALAAHLKAENPTWTGKEIKAEILALAEPLPNRNEILLLKSGWISNRKLNQY